jgi:FkbM family methyltransferase
MKSSIKKQIVSNTFLKNKIYSAAISALKENESDLSFFLEQLEEQLKKTPSRYAELFQRVHDSADENFKFTPRERDKNKWLQEMNINTVIDVGASHGDSVEIYHAMFPSANIFSFEPLKDSYKKLEARKATVKTLKTFNFALGAKAEKVQMHRNEFTPSSSLLKMNQVHKETFPFTSGEVLEEIEVKTLDSVADEITLKSNVLLKLDVQGFEENVLRGGLETLKQVKVIIIEMSFVELYSGQPMFDKIYRLLAETGFVYSGSWHQLRSPKDGRILQQNGIFLRV